MSPSSNRGRAGKIVVSALAAASILLSACATTRFYEREMLSEAAMEFDVDGSLVFVRHKIEAAREGGLGGFGASVAGGCGCQ